MHLSRLFGLTLACFVLCACQKNQYQMQKEWQEQQAKSLKPVELDKGGETAWRRFHVQRLRVYSDAAFVKRVGDVRKYVAEWLDRANQVLMPAMQLRLEVDDFRELPDPSTSTDLDQVLTALHGLDKAEDVDFVVGLVGVHPIMTMSFHDLGRAERLGSYIAIRSMDDAAELRAFAEGLDKIDPAERAALYAQRKRHKETAVLLHELAHTLGALHTRAHDDLMHPNYDQAMVAFSEPNLDLMRYALDERTLDKEQRDDEALVKRIETYLQSSQWTGWIDEERQGYLDALHKAVERGSAAAKAAEAARAPAKPAAPAAPAEDLTPLAEPDRATYLALEQQRREGKWNEAFKAVTGLADRYPKFLPVQQKSCELGMQFGVSPGYIKPYCDRMNALLTQH